jgi:hypothetical protein
MLRGTKWQTAGKYCKYELNNVAASPGYTSVRNSLASMLAEIWDD